MKKKDQTIMIIKKKMEKTSKQRKKYGILKKSPYKIWGSRTRKYNNA